MSSWNLSFGWYGCDWIWNLLWHNCCGLCLYVWSSSSRWAARSDRAVLAGLLVAACSSCHIPHSQGVTSANSKKLYSENRNVVIVLDILPVILYRNCFRMFHGDGAIGDSWIHLICDELLWHNGFSWFIAAEGSCSFSGFCTLCDDPEGLRCSCRPSFTLKLILLLTVRSSFRKYHYRIGSC